MLQGIAVGEHTERSFILDLALALAEDRRRDIVRKTKNGLETARKQGRVDLNEYLGPTWIGRRTRGECSYRARAAMSLLVNLCM